MNDLYKNWLINRVLSRDTDDYVLLNKLAEIKMKGKLLRRVDGATKTLAMSLKDDYIFGEHVNVPDPENRYDGKITMLEFLYALVLPYEYKRPNDIPVEVTKDEHGNNEISEKDRVKIRSKYFFPIFDEFKKYLNKPLILLNMCDDFMEGKFRVFLENKIPNIEKMPIRDQYAIFLHKKKIKKLDKKELSKMIKMTEVEDRLKNVEFNFNNPFNTRSYD